VFEFCLPPAPIGIGNDLAEKPGGAIEVTLRDLKTLLGDIMHVERFTGWRLAHDRSPGVAV
jgi:hypothetical protein